MSTSVTFVGSGDSFVPGTVQHCIPVDAPGIRFAIDFGASSLIALERLASPTIRSTAFFDAFLHGDHCGGIPFLLVDAMLLPTRDRPLTIAGPAMTTERLKSVAAAMMPGMDVMVPKFPITYLDMAVLRPLEIGPLKVTSYPAVHTQQTNPTSWCVEVAESVDAYTGRQRVTEHMPATGGWCRSLDC